MEGEDLVKDQHNTKTKKSNLTGKGQEAYGNFGGDAKINSSDERPCQKDYYQSTNVGFIQNSHLQFATNHVGVRANIWK